MEGGPAKLALPRNNLSVETENDNKNFDQRVWQGERKESQGGGKKGRSKNQTGKIDNALK